MIVTVSGWLSEIHNTTHHAVQRAGEGGDVFWEGSGGQRVLYYGISSWPWLRLAGDQMKGCLSFPYPFVVTVLRLRTCYEENRNQANFIPPLLFGKWHVI